MPDSVSMTSSQLNQALSNVTALKGCSRETLKRIEQEGEKIVFSIGHSLSNKSIISNRILLILSGKARLLSNYNDKLHSLALLGPGALIGLPSLLRGVGCEEVSAATKIEAWSIPDTLIAEIYKQDSCFNSWCNNTLFPAELASLLEFLLNQSERPLLVF